MTLLPESVSHESAVRNLVVKEIDNAKYKTKCVCTNLRNRKKQEIPTSFVFHSLFRCQYKYFFFVLYLLYNVMHVRYCWIYTNKGVDSCHFGPIPYFFSICPTVPYSALLCIRPRIPGDSIPSSRRVKQRFICTSLCRHDITEGGSHFLIKCIYRRAAGMSRLFHLSN